MKKRVILREIQVLNRDSTYKTVQGPKRMKINKNIHIIHISYCTCINIKEYKRITYAKQNA